MHMQRTCSPTYSVNLTNSVQHPVFASKMEALHCTCCMQAVLVRWCGHQCRRLAAKVGARSPRQIPAGESLIGMGNRFRAELLARPLLAQPAAPVSACQAGTQGETWADTGSQEPFLSAIYATASPSMGSESSIYDTKAERHRAHAKSAYRPSGNQQKHSCRIILHQPGKGGDLRTCFAHVH